jgi:hypothetical protein
MSDDDTEESVWEHEDEQMSDHLMASMTVVPREQLYDYVGKPNVVIPELTPDFVYTMAETSRAVLLQEESGPYVRTPLAFEAIRDALVSSPVLAHPDFANQFTVEVDTSDYAVGAMLAQAYDEEKPLALKPGAYATLSRLERSSDQPVWEHDYDVVDHPEIPEIPRGSIDRLTLNHTLVGWIEEQHQDSFFCENVSRVTGSREHVCN